MEEIRGHKLTDRESDNLDIPHEEVERIAEASDKFDRIYVITADELRAALKRSNE